VGGGLDIGKTVKLKKKINQKGGNPGKDGSGEKKLRET